MFYYLKGALVHLENGLAVLDVGGVGYKLTVSGTTYDAMPPNPISALMKYCLSLSDLFLKAKGQTDC